MTAPGSVGASLARISTIIDRSYPADMDSELVLMRRVCKVAEESGEAIQALYGYTGENLRKGVTHTAEGVCEELLDVAIAALCAVEHLIGNYGGSADLLESKVAEVLSRLSACAEATS